MIFRKSAVAVLVAALALGGLLAGGASWSSSPARAQPASAELETEGRAAVEAWLNAVYERDPAKLDAVLAPEFQLLRADGSAHDKASYLASELPVFETAPEIKDLIITGTDALFVARYLVSAKQTRDGVALQTTAPRLSVFRKDGDAWRLVAHANFAALES